MLFVRAADVLTHGGGEFRDAHGHTHMLGFHCVARHGSTELTRHNVACAVPILLLGAEKRWTKRGQIAGVEAASGKGKPFVFCCVYNKACSPPKSMQ